MESGIALTAMPIHKNTVSAVGLHLWEWKVVVELYRLFVLNIKDYGQKSGLIMATEGNTS